ncbi:prepilin-type N-terminal cleavage/methylation domain-containing protein [Candidatus Nomurabacteria bacterium]|nr:prepilin-type N-terminal cleavage/methylation domain-containing protein [Candidatus Nomurabacteria bacterium]
MISKCLKNKKSGFTLLESMFTLFILSLIILAVASFQTDVFRLNRVIHVGLTAQNDIRKIIRPMVDEVRSASESNLGAYPLSETATSTFSFYSDIDNDSLKEKITYFLDGSDFKKGVIKPSGNPYIYDTDDEVITEVVHDVLAVDNIFEYYDSSYDGTASSAPLEFPVSPSSVRLIKIELTVDADPNNPPEAITVTTQINVRNLKDNL